MTIMTPAALPALQYPFDVQEGAHRNPYEQEIEAAISGWIDHEYLFLSEAQRAYYKKCRFGMLSSCFYPEASYEALEVGARLVLLLFIHDDYTDKFSYDELQSYLLKSGSIMAGNHVPHDKGDMLHQFVLFRKALQPLVPATWMQRWNSDLSYFYEGMLMERLFTAQQYPSIQQYIFLREHLIGMHIYQDITELYMPSFMPHELLFHPHVRELRQSAVRIIAWCHDYYSVEKELDAGQIMNLVLVIQQERRCSLEDAFVEMAHVHDEEVNTFLRLKEHAPDFGPYNELFREYAHHLQLMFKGNYLWHLESGRYNKF
ncbi:terpene synthase family protein [Chitinophaga japonensis]|uniref:Terpene synthase n=1 Tax=Chitinophaga japonensis TaxID=104662 RepID=A0A562TEX3_CHIJA|nr:hypothetical protein [Chitinophaga japonensis]TWI92079.1 hypothetical protein LX66_1461 [Chitinophaga japonensis]